MIHVSRATPADFAAIVELQERNHGNNLGADARDDGFLTTYLDAPKLETLVCQNGLFVAKSEDELAGFVCSEAWSLSQQHDFYRCAAALFPLILNEREINISNSRLYGPVCVAATFRGQNVLSRLVEIVRCEFGAQFDFGVTFIDHRNARSLAAHERKLGFSLVAQLPYENTNYHVLAFPL